MSSKVRIGQRTDTLARMEMKKRPGMAEWQARGNLFLSSQPFIVSSFFLFSDVFAKDRVEKEAPEASSVVPDKERDYISNAHIDTRWTKVRIGPFVRISVTRLGDFLKFLVTWFL